ncbi:D-alanyl-D-alanine carboxypeptidase [Acetoanaerobium pronyense]|uniref:D-alanyl-D-alanine carboxypeptidase n=1 Tax=Acetoanaerobium pronyense TaxID=1482736 RepID=A0ABS4KKQ2_9FIRM|nr:serine hydrolase domain-containing protein [Acetoanaerobium pronyense]MBP2028364.1 D-alanyl-D-alanine carboxypeptidase [Acetoanaerobium pronyense]
MKLRFKILIAIISCLIIAISFMLYLNRPISEEVANAKINKHLTKVVDDNDSLSSALMTISSNKTGYFGQFAVGKANMSTDEPVKKTSQFHSASIGKTMCATIYGLLVDEGKIQFEDKISSWLEEDLEGLFIVDGIDYSGEVTIEHLLRHTSGVGDYFQDPVDNGKTMLEMIKENPDLMFTPENLIAFTREYQRPVGKPGEQFHYSDTGYILLGLILEEIEQKPYSEILHERIFESLDMNDSYLMFYEDEETDILGIYIDGMDYSDKNALSLDWSGGGIVTTMDDLLAFMMALESGNFLSYEVYSQMTDFKEKYDKGIYYGMGMMRFDFSELSPLLGFMTDVYGGMGTTGVYMFYDKEKDTYFIANFGSIEFMEKSIEELIKIRMIFDRMVIK